MNEQEQTTEKINVQPEEHKCACGCGNDTKPLKGGGYAKFIPGHWNKLKEGKELEQSTGEEGEELVDFAKRNKIIERPEGELQEQIAEPQPLVITDLRDYHTDDVAWFQVEVDKYTYLTIDYIGQINGGAYSVLVRTQQGIFLPPYLIPRFVGLASVNTQPEPQVKEPESEPEPVVPIDDETFHHDLGAPIQQEKKPGLLAKLMGKKEPQVQENPRKSGTNLAEMLRTT